MTSKRAPGTVGGSDHRWKDPEEAVLLPWGQESLGRLGTKGEDCLQGLALIFFVLEGEALPNWGAK